MNNILAVHWKPLKYAAECDVIDKAPRIGLFKVERPEIVCWDFEQYARPDGGEGGGARVVRGRVPGW